MTTDARPDTESLKPIMSRLASPERATLGWNLLVMAGLWLITGCAGSLQEGSPESTIKVISYNLRYADETLYHADSRKDNLLASLNHHRPDVLGVQEANEPWMDVLTSSLQGYEHVGVGRDDGEAAGERSAVFFLKDKYEVVDSGTFWLSETPAEPSFGWGANHRRVCTWAYLRNRLTGETTAFFNTHLDHEVHDARTNGVAMILERIRETPHPVVLMGDFNVVEDSELYQTIEDTDLADTKSVAAESKPFSTFNRFIPDEDSARIIDFIFVQEAHFDVFTYEVDHSWKFDGKPVSDHYPVIAELGRKGTS